MPRISLVFIIYVIGKSNLQQRGARGVTTPFWHLLCTNLIWFFFRSLFRNILFKWIAGYSPKEVINGALESDDAGGEQ